jgi:hypothetical protein
MSVSQAEPPLGGFRFLCAGGIIQSVDDQLGTAYLTEIESGEVTVRRAFQLELQMVTCRRADCSATLGFPAYLPRFHLWLRS